MKVLKVVSFDDQEVEVDIGIDEIVATLCEVPEDAKTYQIGRAVTHAWEMLKSIPESMIVAMGEKSRRTISEALAVEAKRWEVKP